MKQSTLKILLGREADINLRDDNQATALMWAAYQGHTEAVKLLIDSGANLTYKNTSGYTALMLAEFNGYQDIVRLLSNAKGEH